MVTEIHTPSESDNERFRCPIDKDDSFYDDIADDELGFFGIVIKKISTPSCPYDQMRQYIPRSQRR